MADLGTHSGNAKAVLIDATGQRHYKATTGADTATGAKSDQTFELAAGASITIHYRQGTTGAPTTLGPTAAEVVVLEDDSSGGGSGGTVVRTFAVADPGVDESFTFFATSTGASGGASRRGTYRARVQASRVSAPPLATDWLVNSDNFNTDLPAAAGAANDWGRGYLRAGDALSSFAYSDASLGGAAPANNRFVYPKSQFFRESGGAVPLQSAGTTRQVTLAQRQAGAQKSTDNATMSGSAVTDWTRTGGVGASSGVNNDFVAGDTATDVRLTLASSTLSGQPWTHWTSVPGGWTGSAGSKGAGLVQADRAALYLIDPRITFSQLLQLNDATFGTPPSSKNVASGQRLASDLAFVGARATDAHGAGINALAWTEKLWDAANLISSEGSPWKSRSSTGTTQGGQAGWSDALMTWDAQLPGGGWTQKETITTTKATGLEVSNTRTLTLLAANPNFRAVVAAGPSSVAAEGDHWHAGEPLLVTFTVIDLSTRLQATLDASPAPAVILLRFNQGSQKVQFLDGSSAWIDADAGAAHEHTLTVSPSDPMAFTLTFSGAQTAGWGDLDLMAILARAYINSTPYHAVATREAVGGKWHHNAQEPEASIIWHPTTGHAHLGAAADGGDDSVAIGDRS